jgi:hypothetical protein
MFKWLKNIFSSSSVRVFVRCTDGEEGITTIHYSGCVTDMSQLIEYAERKLGKSIDYAKVIEVI